jgi:hypothetical protein
MVERLGWHNSGIKLEIKLVNNNKIELVRAEHNKSFKA